jgi:hypothetical protein
MQGINNDPSWDADSLARAEEIKRDPGRLKAAQEAARINLAEQGKKMEAMARVANIPVKEVVQKPTQPKRFNIRGEEIK